jgi:hypothetical protein
MVNTPLFYIPSNVWYLLASLSAAQPVKGREIMEEAEDEGSEIDDNITMTPPVKICVLISYY